jgi:hypothetical protein
MKIFMPVSAGEQSAGDGLETTLSNTNSLAEAIAVSGNDVYVVGRDYNGHNRQGLCLET